MDFFNANGIEENLSITDMIECDIRGSNFNEHITNGDSNSGFGSMGIGTILDYDINSLDMSDSKTGLASLLNGADLNWMNSVNLSNLQQLCKTENSDPNLMVNPQTGLPASESPIIDTTTTAPLLSQAPGVTIMDQSAVRQALLRTPDHTTYVAVAPSQVQQQPQYLQVTTANPSVVSGVTSVKVEEDHHVDIGEDEDDGLEQDMDEDSEDDVVVTQSPVVVSLATTIATTPTISRQNSHNNNSQTIRQHLQAQVNRSLPSPQSPVSSYQVSSPQPMVVSSPQKSAPKAAAAASGIEMNTDNKIYPKPVYSYSCLIAMALKNSENGSLPVSEIYNFMTENFPYFKTAPDGWKNSVRHNLSLNKCFEKIENPKSTGTTKKGCLWGMNPAKVEKMEEEIAKWRKKDPVAIKRSMANPDVLDLLEAGQGGRSPRHHTLTTTSSTKTLATAAASNNNNITKTAAMSQVTTTVPSQKMELSKVVTNISANVNVIEIKPVKVDPAAAGGATTIKEEQLANLTQDELSVLDNNITLDPAISDLAIQSGLFGAVSGMMDDFNADELNLDEFTSAGSPLTFSLSSAGLTASPIHFNAGASGAGTGNVIVTPTIDEKGAIQTGFNLFNCSAATPSSTPSTPGATYTLARTLTAQT